MEKVNIKEIVKKYESIGWYLSKIIIWHDVYIHAIQQGWTNKYTKASSITRICSNDTNLDHLQCDEINLSQHEYITAIHGRIGDILDHLQITTNTNQHYKFGTSLGGQRFTYHIDQQYRTISLNLGYGGHIHAIGISTIPYFSFEEEEEEDFDEEGQKKKKNFKKKKKKRSLSYYYYCSKSFS